MEYTTSLKNINVLCRICLTVSKNLSSLKEPLEDKFDEFSSCCTIEKMLEAVTSNKVITDEKKFPSNICQMCLSLLKLAYEFQVQFRNSQDALQKITQQTPVVKIQKPAAVVEVAPNPAAPVELIYGENKFDLSDVLVLEEEPDDKFTFDGFLKNLGTEISARFVSEHEEPSKPTHETNAVVIEPLNPKRPESIPIDRLQVKKIPEESKIIIEEVTDMEATGKIVKTLYECETCKRLFESKLNLEAHCGACPKARAQFVCHKCGHIAQSTSALYHHLQNHKGKRFGCNLCDKKFVTSSRLKSHLQVHKNERPFLCNICGKNFNYAIALQYHMRLHTGEKKFVCNFCGLRYRMPYTLKRHLRTHTKEKPYPCGFCHKKFSSVGEKKCHEMQHTGQRPFRCEYCGKGYIKAGNLKYHHLGHEGPHACHFCPKTFIDVRFLRVHLKRTHGDDVQVEEDEEEVEMGAKVIVKENEFFM